MSNLLLLARLVDARRCSSVSIDLFLQQRTKDLHFALSGSEFPIQTSVEMGGNGAESTKIPEYLQERVL